MSALARADALLDLGRHREAIEHAHRALADTPDDAAALTILASAHVSLGEHREGLAAATDAVALAPEDPWAHRLRAISLGALKRKGEARAAAETATALAPEAVQNLIVLADALQDCGDEAGALAAAGRATALQPADPTTHEQLGILHLRHGELDLAEACFRRSLAIDPVSKTAHNNLAVVDLARGRTTTAAAGLDRAARLDPRSELVRDNLVLTAHRRYGILRVVAVVCVVMALPTPWGQEDGWGGAAILLGVAVACELLYRNAQPKLSPQAQALVRDHRRARRFQPWRWDWKRPTRYRLLWWSLLEQLPPMQALGVNGLLIVAGAAFPPAAIFGVCALPFSIRRAWRHWRRRRPPAGSWRPPA